MIRKVPAEEFLIWSSSEGTEIGYADRNCTLGICHQHDYNYLQFIFFFGGDFEPFKVSQTQGSLGG